MCSAQAAMAPGQAISQNAQGKLNESYYNNLGNQVIAQGKELDKTTDENLATISENENRAMVDAAQDTDQIVASQKATMAANGVYSDSGTFSDIIDDSIDKLALNQAAIKYNADQEKWATKRAHINNKLSLYSQESSYRIQGSNARSNGRRQSLNTLIGGAVSGVSSAASMYSAAGSKPGIDSSAGTSSGSSLSSGRSMSSKRSASFYD